MSSTRVTNPWLLMRTVDPHSRLNLICFPYAGGGAQLFNNWQAAFGDVQICAVQYPGRGSRVREPAFTDCRELVQAFVPHLLPFLNKPFAFFGHSMGAIIAYEVARHLQQQHGLQLERLIVSGRRAQQHRRFIHRRVGSNRLSQPSRQRAHQPLLKQRPRRLHYWPDRRWIPKTLPKRPDRAEKQWRDRNIHQVVAGPRIQEPVRATDPQYPHQLRQLSSPVLSKTQTFGGNYEH